MKINLGCGGKPLEGYINVDIDPETRPDVVTTADRLDFCADGGADEIRLDATYEHLYFEQRRRSLVEWMRCLRPGGLLNINWIPDAEVAADLFVSHNTHAIYGGKCGKKNCGPTDDFPHWNLEMFERVTSGAIGLHHEKPYQLHKGLFSKEKVVIELTSVGFEIMECINRRFGDERGQPYNICVIAKKPRGNGQDH